MGLWNNVKGVFSRIGGKDGIYRPELDKRLGAADKRLGAADKLIRTV